MQKSNKFLSVILTLTLIVSSISVGFIVFAASENVSETEWDNLVAAISKDYVKNAAYTDPASPSTTTTVKVNDNTSGEIEAALNAFSAVAKKTLAPNVQELSTTNNNNTAPEVAETIYDYLIANYKDGDTQLTAGYSDAQLKTLLQRFTGAMFTVPPAAATNIFAIRTTAPSNATGSPIGLTINTRIHITRNVKNLLLACASVADIPSSGDIVTGVYFNWAHSKGGSDNNYYHYINAADANIAGNATEVKSAAANVPAFSAIKNYYNAFAGGVKTAEEIKTMTYDDALSLYNAGVSAYNALVANADASDSQVMSHFGMLNINDAAAYLAALAYYYPALYYVPQVKYFNSLDLGEDFSSSNRPISELYALRSKSTAQFNILEQANESVKDILVGEFSYDEKAVAAFRRSLSYEIGIRELTSFHDYFNTNLPLTENKDNWNAQSVASWLLNFTRNYAAVTFKTDGVPYYTADAINKVFANGEITGSEYLMNTGAAIDSLVDEFLAYLNSVGVPEPIVPDSYFNPARLGMDVTILPDKLLLTELNKGVEKYEELLSTYGEEGCARMFGAEYFVKITAYVMSLGYNMNKRLESQLMLAIDKYDEQGGRLNQTTVRMWASMIGGVSKSFYDTLLALGGKYTFLSKTVKDNWHIVGERLAEYTAFVEAKGFVGTDGFEGYLHNTISPYQAGVEMPRNIIKKGDVRYAVTESSIESIMTKLDDFLNSKQLSGLLGALGVNLADTLGVDGEVSGVSDLIGTALEDSVYTEKTINTLMYFIYPMVCEALSDALGSNLGIAFNFLPTLQVNSWPQHLADVINSDYPNLIAKLKTSSDQTAAAWKQFIALDPETGKDLGYLDLDWTDSTTGQTIHDRASFVKAFGQVITGLVAAFKASMTNRAMKTNAFVLIIDVKLGMPAGNGYDLGILPMLELLGCTGMPATAQFNATLDTADSTFVQGEYIANSFLEPLLRWLENDVGNSPLKTVTSLLPNMAYSMIFDMISFCLGQLLKGKLAYNAGFLGAGEIDIDTVLSISGLLRDQAGLDVTSIDGIMGTLFGALGVKAYDPAASDEENEGAVVLPTVDTEFASSLGILTKLSSDRSSGSRYYIDANNADVFYQLLRWIFKSLGNTAFVEGIAQNFSDEDKETGKKKPVELSDEVKDILKNISANPDSAIAAVVELFEPQKYDMKPTVNADDLAAAQSGKTALDTKVMYTSVWTQKQAQYLSKNLDEFLNSTSLLLTGVGFDQLIGVLLGGGSLYSHKTLETLMGLLDGVLKNLEDFDTSIIDTIESLLNISISGLFDMLKTDISTLDFKDGDKNAFLAAVADWLAPALPLLDVLLSGKDLEVAGGLITAYGYDGYANGLIPLLEALGCEQKLILTPAEYEAAPDDKIANILTPILDLLEKILDNPSILLTKVLPNIFYFADSGMLQNSLDNVLFPVYVLLDVIRPIYDVDFYLDADLTALVGGLINGLGMDMPFELGNMVAGSLEEFTSKNGQAAVRVSDASAGTADYITLLLRTFFSTLLYGDNFNALKEFLADLGLLNPAALSNSNAFIDKFATMSVDTILYVLYNIFFGLKTGVDNINVNIKEANDALKEVSAILAQLSSIPYLSQFTDRAKALLNEYFGGVFGIDEDNIISILPKGLIGFIYTIINLFRKLFGMEPIPLPI